MSCRPMFCEGRADCGDRHCPGHPVNSDEELTRRQQEAELRWQCRSQMDSRQRYEHERAGELDAIGVEAADAPRVTGTVPPIVTTELRPVREPISGQAKVLIAAVILTWLAVGLLSIP